MSERRSASKLGRDAGNPDRWEKAQLVVGRPSTVMVSVRLPAELGIELESFAAQRSMSISEVVRLATERLVKGASPAPTYALIGTTQASSLKLAGPTVLVHAVSSGTRPIWELVPQLNASITGTAAN